MARRVTGGSLTAYDCRRIFEYDRQTGLLYRMQRSGREPKQATRFNAGSAYGRVAYGGTTYSSAAIVWALMKSEWPAGPLKHKNGDLKDDRIENLEPLARSGPFEPDTPPPAPYFMVTVIVDGEPEYCGRCCDEEEAAEAIATHLARLEAKRNATS